VIKDIYRQSQDCLFEDMGGDILLYQPSTARAMQLNDSSLMVWQLCDGLRSVEDIILAIGELHPDQADQISEDTCYAIKMLLDNQALELIA
jgi:hypothetical protein